MKRHLVYCVEEEEANRMARRLEVAHWIECAVEPSKTCKDRFDVVTRSRMDAAGHQHIRTWVSGYYSAVADGTHAKEVVP